jgi:hypothetical protein
MLTFSSPVNTVSVPILFVLLSTFARLSLNNLQLLAIHPSLLNPNTLQSPSGNFYRCVVNILFSLELLVMMTQFRAQNFSSTLTSFSLPLSLSLSLCQCLTSTDTLSVFHFVTSQTRPRVLHLEA